MNIPDRCSSLRKNQSEAAFTLTELMIGCAILGIMVVSLFGGISFGFSNITLARQNLRATQIVLEKMEIIRMYSWDQINSNGFVPTTFNAPFFPERAGTPATANSGLTYYGAILITNVSLSTTYDNDIRQVIVTLNWTNRDVPQSLEMSTYVSQYGMQRFVN